MNNYYMYLSPSGYILSLTPTYPDYKDTDILKCNMNYCFEETIPENKPTKSTPLETFYLKKATSKGVLVNCYVHSKLNNPEGLQRIANYFDIFVL